MDANFRSGVTNMYRDHVIGILGYEIPKVPSADALIHLAKRITVPAFEAERGWRTDAPFPGVTEEPEEMRSGWRMICATRFYVDNVETAVMYMTLVSGRTCGVVLSLPGTVIPKQYLPLTSR